MPEREYWVADEYGVRSVVVTEDMIDAAMPELLKFEPSFSDPRETLSGIIGAALMAMPPAMASEHRGTEA